MLLVDKVVERREMVRHAAAEWRACHSTASTLACTWTTCATRAALATHTASVRSTVRSGRHERRPTSGAAGLRDARLHARLQWKGERALLLHGGHGMGGIRLRWHWPTSDGATLPWIGSCSVMPVAIVVVTASITSIALAGAGPACTVGRAFSWSCRSPV